MLGGTFLLAIAGIVIYTPWRTVPYDILDFSEFLPLLQKSAGPIGSFDALLEYYGSHGRVNPLTSALIALQWELLGSDPVAWRWFRVGLMSICIALSLWLLRRLRVTLLPALLATLLLVVSMPAAASWLRLAGEPLIFIWFAVGLIGVTYTSYEGWGRMVAVAAAALALVLTKETAVVFLAPLWLFAVSWRSGWLRKPKPTRHVVATTLVVMVIGLVALAVAWISLQTAAREAYVQGYGLTPIRLTWLVRNLSAIFFPLSSVAAPLLPHAVVLLLVLVSGWYFALASPVGRSSHIALGLTMALTILLGATVYLPWVRFEHFYAMPFLLPVIVLLAVALKGFLQRPAGVLWLTLFLVVLVPPTIAVKYRAERTHAQRILDRLLVERVAQISPDSLFVYGRVASQPWQGKAATVARYVRIVDPDSRVVGTDRTCEERDQTHPVGGAKAIEVSYEATCGVLIPATERLEVSFKYWVLPPARGSDTLVADLRWSLR